MKPRILLVEDEARQRDLFLLNFGDSYAVTAVDRGEAGLERLASEPFSAIVLDMRTPGMDGLEFIERAKSMGVTAPTIVTTAYATVESAVDAMKLGAYDYLTKPFQLDVMERVIERAVTRARLEEENKNLRAQLRQRYGAESLVGDNHAFRQAVERAVQVAGTHVPVLIQGDSGTGKELIARLIHAQSPRAGGAFVTLNCAAIPDELLESELFGYEKGAFTGAARSKPGKFEAADGGTLLLDEIGDMKLQLQAKILRAIEEREVTRLGSTTPRTVDVRILASSNQPLTDQVAEKRFRQDLYFRLNVVAIQLPALRHRADDIPLLIGHFLAKHRPGEEWRVDEAALATVRSYAWPGNVRELENAIQGALVFAKDRCIRVADLPEALQHTPLAIAAPAIPKTNAELKAARRRLATEAVRELEIAFLRQALADAHGNISEAARQTAMPRRQLHRLIERHGVASSSNA